MDKVTEITRLFYEEHKRPTDIAEELDVAKSYVTKIIQKDERYIQDKESRIIQSKEKHKASKRLYINKKREQNRQDYEVLIRKINADNAKMLTHSKLTDENFAKWNSGMYEYDKNSSNLDTNTIPTRTPIPNTPAIIILLTRLSKCTISVTRERIG